MDSIALTGLDQLIADQPGTSRPDAYRYLGFSIRETTGLAGAVVEIFDGLDSGGKLIESIAISSGGSVREYYPNGVILEDGLFVNVVSGTVRGSVRIE